MNKITASSLNIERSVFKKLVKAMFDDCFDISEEFAKHSACNVQIGAHISKDYAEMLADYSLLVGIDPSELVGTWMIDVLRDYSWGIEWDMVDEAVKVEKITETITVTKWKPICDENATAEVPCARPPCSKE